MKSIYDLIYLTPLIPLSFKGEGENVKKRGFAPLRHPGESGGWGAKPLKKTIIGREGGK